MMRFMPDVRRNLFDSMFEPFGANFTTMMRTDVREKDGRYYLDITLPGYRKEDIKISLYNGNLTVAVASNATDVYRSIRIRDAIRDNADILGITT